MCSWWSLPFLSGSLVDWLNCWLVPCCPLLFVVFLVFPSFVPCLSLRVLGWLVGWLVPICSWCFVAFACLSLMFIRVQLISLMFIKVYGFTCLCIICVGSLSVCFLRWLVGRFCVCLICFTIVIEGHVCSNVLLGPLGGVLGGMLGAIGGFLGLLRGSWEFAKRHQHTKRQIYTQLCGNFSNTIHNCLFGFI